MRRLLLDEMLSPAVAAQLRAAGADAVAVGEVAALRGLPDPQVLEAAAADGRVLVTANARDFLPLDAAWAAAGRTHPGILVVTVRAFPQDASLPGRLVAALRAWLADDAWPPPGQAGFL